MQKRPLGQSGLSVACVGLGAMPLSIAGRPSESDGIRVIHAALDAGMDLIDTANVYCLNDGDIGHNEKLIAKALASWKGARDRVVVATKGGLERPRGDWVSNGRPDYLQKACERSLRALGVEAITLYQLHAPDRKVPFENSIGALADLRKAGKILHAGLSNVRPDEIKAAEKIVPVVSVQNPCNVFDRGSFSDGTVSYCEKRGIAFLCHSAVGGHRGKARAPKDTTLNRVARRLGATPYEVCLAWLLAVSPVTIPIPGASQPESARSSVGAAGLKLSSGDLAELSRAFPLS